jgi:predicted nucleic acid-binding protein
MVGLGAVIQCTLLRAAPDVGTTRAGGPAGAQPRADARRRPVTRYLVDTNEIAGGLADLARGRGHSPGFADVAIAATARRHDLIILSRNERHFATMDVAVIDPFQKLP